MIHGFQIPPVENLSNTLLLLVFEPSKRLSPGACQEIQGGVG